MSLNIIGCFLLKVMFEKNKTVIMVSPFLLKFSFFYVVRGERGSNIYFQTRNAVLKWHILDKC